ncbi:MAG TPA: CbtA family protein [Stellaceae bacterium]|nr:CbtA family protein [Stellaceae bacterium]
MAALRRTLLAGLLAGILAGGIVTALQAVRVAPLILAAEVYESAAEHAAPPGHDHAAAAGHDHSAAAEWEPEEGLERTGFTLLANVVVACGFALLLAAAFAWREAAGGGDTGASRGFLWGLAGFAVFSLAPSLGLPPTPPGSLTADLASRQGWWLLTVAATGAGLGLAVFMRSWLWRISGLALLALPHLLGAPKPPPGASAVPAEVATQFALASLATAALFWILLGTVGGWLYRRLGAPQRA